jgi:hypothetical protein
MTVDVFDVDPVVVVYLQHASPLNVHILDMSDLQQSSAYIYIYIYIYIFATQAISELFNNAVVRADIPK